MFPYTAPSSEPIPDTTSDTIDPAVDTTPSKLYGAPMRCKFNARYNEDHIERQKEKAAADERHKQELAFERQVQVCCWMKDDKEPVWAREQGIMTFPKLNLASHPLLLKKLGLTAMDQLSIYDFDGKFFQLEDVDHVMQITTRHVILARYAGVKRCPRLNEFIDKYSPKPVTSGAHRAAPSASKRKSNPALLSLAALLVIFAATLVSITVLLGIFAATLVSITVLLVIFAATLVSITVLLVIFATTLVSITLLAITIANTTTSTITSGSLRGTWQQPKSKMTMMADRFGEIFQAHVPVKDRKFPKGTWYQQLAWWDLCSQEERDIAAELPRTPDGLWTTWHSASSGWAEVLAKKRK
ncbi:hypothetical protein MSAN_01617700 [Mycena sanguinolenta]|uniref:Uncharacterized protein n=1 Tax=Mycena sanguinolenta TaxID=230812 RepID=A0A8H7CWB3_9AGAR|nr:hypothetical protein MSAN_01617700 [Mycena sanguinolenta]